MSLGRKKIAKKNPDAFEEQVGQALSDLENSSNELRAELRDLKIASAKEVEIPGKQTRKAVVIFVPYPSLPRFHRIQKKLVNELEKKFGKQVVLIAQRRILRKPGKNNRRPNTQKRPRSRTLTAVHDAILEDIVYPTEIVGKRTRYRLHGAKLLKVFLDRKDQANTEHKLESFRHIYRRLTGKDVEFVYPPQQQTLA
eukprot:TRINITY_DN1357_c0_g1_i1.p1 TRINITY_DN1357_c0_g1~~TRINITY_DN1357_c0_g1_i1.p1  ORF type:complete len:230 (+),score=92.11 TRINITY_DN1357_c0_g1_i1:100-690(+)